MEFSAFATNYAPGLENVQGLQMMVSAVGIEPTTY
jgi:hypothetical protein